MSQADNYLSMATRNGMISLHICRSEECIELSNLASFRLMARYLMCDMSHWLSRLVYRRFAVVDQQFLPVAVP
jgi:hypothetical protein